MVQEEHDIAIYAIEEETAGRHAMQQYKAMYYVYSHQVHSVVTTFGHPASGEAQEYVSCLWA
jgi:hypothetical protein